jgi:8-oxo-dGTP pyrophosphatase MutT (NUDIX family)
LEKINSSHFNLMLKEVLSQKRIARIFKETRKPSAVLIPMYYYQEQHYLVFTKRTDLVRYHKGEISFPGGGYHDEDGKLVNTALRETWEEIGLASEDVDVLGELDDILTRYSQYIISPFVGSIPSGYAFRLNAFETAEIIQIPVSGLQRPDCRREGSEILDGESITTYTYTWENRAIIGATARILKQFLDIYSQVIEDLKTTQG